MALDATTQALIDRLTAATAAIETRIQTLTAAAASAGATATAEVDTALTPIADQLTALGTPPAA